MLGDPRAHTSYQLCVFDDSGETPRLLTRSAFPLGPSWRPSKTGFTYQDRLGDERRKIQIRAGTPGKIAARLRAVFLASLPFPLPVPLVLQVQTSDAGCFGARFAAGGVIRNDAEVFRAVSDP